MKKHTYTVKKGDTLWDIAKAHGTTVDRLLELNPDINDPNFIYPDEKITLKPSVPPPLPPLKDKSSSTVWWIAGLMAVGAALLAFFAI